MILGHGIDFINENRISELLVRYGKRFECRYFTKSEMSRAESARNNSSVYAKCWAAKEAFSKALGTGFRDGLFLKDISLDKDQLGKPLISLNKRSKTKLYDVFSGEKLIDVHVSIADDFPWVQASVIICQMNSFNSSPSRY